MQTLARLASRLVPVAIALVLAACSQGNSGDSRQQAGATAIPTGIDRFLLFPNPVQSGTASTFETNTSGYADAYYGAVDPTGTRATLAGFKAANGITGVDSAQEHLAIFRDVRDLGYGRRMTGRINGSGASTTVAFIVENYNISTIPGQYSTINVDAAVVPDPRWHIGTNAIEWSATPCDAAKDPATCSSTVKFAKFYNFDPVTGVRQSFVDLDGKGLKAMPGPCISCHGGRADPLTPPDGSGQPRFPLVANSASQKRGDLQGRMQPFLVDTFEWSTQPQWTRAAQEANLKDFNTWVLCTFPLAGGAAGAEDNCRQTASGNEWQGTATAEMLKSFYGGTGLPAPTYADTYVPAGWSGAPALYTQVIVPFCRSCHLVRGTGNQSDIDFATKAKFDSYLDRVKVHVFDRGNMPLALLVYTDFWGSSAPATLAAYIDSISGPGTATSGGAALRPGRPIADAGPDRMVRTNADSILSATDSLFASTYNWALVSAPGGGSATITSPNSATATFRPATDGDYVVRLTVGNGSASDTKTITIVANATFPTPAAIKFVSVKNILQNVVHAGTSQTCVACHDNGGVAPAVSNDPPVAFNTFDRDTSGGIDATDDTWLLKEVVGRVNFTDITASPLLRKPAGNHHNGAATISLAGGSAATGLSDFSKVYHWILNGTPTGGVAANAGTSSTNTVTFAPTADIALDGSASLGATTFAWTVVSAPGGATASILTPSAVTATLRVDNVGVYVVQLQVGNGADTDIATRTITVQETPVGASFTPSGNVAVTFTGTPLEGPITLTNTSTGAPTTCLWAIVSGPAGASFSSTSSCTTTTLTVPATAVGGSYQIRFTGDNLSTTDNVVNTINVLSAGSGVNANAGADTSSSFTFSVPSVGGIPDSTAIPTPSTISLDGSASTGPGTLTYAWTVTAAPGDATGSYAPSIASASSASTSLTVHRAGSYTVQLVVDNGLPQGAGNTDTRNITVNVTPTFTQVKATLVSRGCTAGGCHSSGSTVPPSWVDETVTGQTLYQRVLADVSAAAPATSLMVVCPAEGTCGMGQQTGFHTGDTTSYLQFLNWIIGGALNN